MATSLIRSSIATSLKSKDSTAYSLRHTGQSRLFYTQSQPIRLRRICITNTIQSTDVVEKTVHTAPLNNESRLKFTVVIKRRPGNKIMDIFKKGLDFFVNDPLGEDITLQLVSTEVDPNTGMGRLSKETTLEKVTSNESMVVYSGEIEVDQRFGLHGAVCVLNKHKSEFFLETIEINGLKHGPVKFCCYSWVHPQDKNFSKRIFFYNEAFLPCDTPEGLKKVRGMELETLQGNGKGVRKPWERIYDYDVYNDLGDPDKDKKLARPVAGGSVAYPRRCRTGRPPTKSDPLSESRLAVTDKNYVPRDEDFEEIKSQAFSSGRLRAIVHRLVPTIITHFTATPDEFDSLTDIDRLYYEGIQLQNEQEDTSNPFKSIAEFIKEFIDADEFITALKYPLSPLLQKDKLAWTRDSEFGRQMLAGLNPMKIERLKEFPPRSHLSKELCGSEASALKAVELEKHLEGLCLHEAMEAEKLFIVDYHDIYMPIINNINSQEGRKVYATRTILYLDSSNLLRPIGIELCLPVSKTHPDGLKRAFYPSNHPTDYWLWQLSKTHVRSNHSSYHQVVSHWLQTHACIEPYIIASNRQLSAMHPVYKLIDPHFRYTMQINATARQTLINANGVIEKCFTPGKYILNLSALGYQEWRFDEQGLPADLLKRGMAVEDKQSPHGLRLIIEDYPYAADGLLVWSAIKSWVTSYISVYYDTPEAITNDNELQTWWNEIQTKGHPDKKEGWPTLRTKEDLIEILTSMIWVGSGHHAAVNFGQFLYAGYILNLPCMTRKLIPEVEDEVEYKKLVEEPQCFLLRTLPNQVQATTVMAVLELLSTHHPDEEYLGQRVQRFWTNEKRVLEASDRFEKEMEELGRIIIERNKDSTLVHRHGAGVPPYELLLPRSTPGITARGVPNSVSI